MCVKGCFCKKGFLANEVGGCCVKPEECGDCTGNRTYTDCGSACPPTCSNWREERMCIDVCVVGCFCKSGYVALDDGGKSRCVLPKDCPKLKKTIKGKPYAEDYRMTI
ncbi:unnamed protein product [Staurois parvus]|uniref:TIL domain-containing protein n=1 Tax=Staurois parvus TaxID=386267 RepID=A0ABN9GFM6_9NEOB|nr:unnamed protein product [Staurois parvus]